MNNHLYASITGSLMYVMVCTRPNITYRVSLVSIYMANPGKAHWQGLKWILRYIKGFMSKVLVYGWAMSDGEVDDKGFVEFDHVGYMDTRKYLSRYVFVMFGTTISWKASLQKVVVLSTTEAEYVALTEVVKKQCVLKGLLWNWNLKSCYHC